MIIDFRAEKRPRDQLNQALFAVGKLRLREVELLLMVSIRIKIRLAVLVFSQNPPNGPPSSY